MSFERGPWSPLQREDNSDLRRHPPGIVILGVLNFFGAFIAFVILTQDFNYARADEGIAWLAVGIEVLAVLLGLLLTFGLWRLKDWAYPLTLVVYGASIALSIIGMIAGGFSWAALLRIGVAAGIIIYFCNLKRCARPFAPNSTFHRAAWCWAVGLGLGRRAE